MADIVQILQVTRAQIGVTTVDASITEDHVADVDTTENPVEQGTDITDHARPKQRVLTMEGVVSNAATTSGGTADPTRAVTAYKQLIALHDTPALVTIVTSLETYTNMLMTHLSVPRDAKTGQAVRFTASFKEVQIVETQTIQIARKVPKTMKNANLGKQAATPAAPPKSFLLGGFQKVGVGSGKGGIFAP